MFCGIIMNCYSDPRVQFNILCSQLLLMLFPELIFLERPKTVVKGKHQLDCSLRFSLGHTKPYNCCVVVQVRHNIQKNKTNLRIDSSTVVHITSSRLITEVKQLRPGERTSSGLQGDIQRPFKMSVFVTP